MKLCLILWSWLFLLIILSILYRKAVMYIQSASSCSAALRMACGPGTLPHWEIKALTACFGLSALGGNAYSCPGLDV